MKMIYRRWIGVLLLILAAAMLYGCGLAGNGSSAPRLRFPGHVRARADDTRLSLEKLTHQDVPEAAELLMQMTALEELDLGSDGLWTGEGQAEGEAASPATLRDLTPEDLLTLREGFYHRRPGYEPEECGCNRRGGSFGGGSAFDGALPDIGYGFLRGSRCGNGTTAGNLAGDGRDLAGDIR